MSVWRYAIEQGLALLLCGALSACATGRPAGDVDARWIEEPPRACAVGFSGPTLDPGDAIRKARTHSLETLAAEQLGVEIESELWIGEHGTREFTEQTVRGVMERSRIVAMTARLQPGADSELREVYALACPNERPTSDIPHPDFPSWILNLPRSPGRICAMGVGGPTWYPAQQREATLRDARAALALAIESRIETHSLDLGRGLAHVRSSSESTERARDEAASADGLEEAWLDEAGAGPLRLVGVLYGVTCIVAR